MTSELRSRRKPCLRSPRGTLVAVVGAVALIATAPAAAAEPEFLKPLGWYADEATAPASVNFNDVAAAGDDTVVAVGTTNTGAPAIYTRTGGGWQAAPVDPPLPTAGSLDDVVLGEGAGWAVGTAGPEDARTPLVLELVAGVWTNRGAATAGPAAPTTVTLNSSGAIIGDAAGTIHWLAPGGGQLNNDEKLTGAGAINGISRLLEGSPRFAVADYDYLAAGQSDNGVRIYEIGAPSLLDVDEQADTPEVDMTGLAALSSNQAVATDSEGRTWRVTRASGQNDWKQGNSPPVEAGVPELADVASVKYGPAPYDGAGWATEFLAGNVAGAGAIWHRTRWTTDAEAWNPDPLPAGTPAVSGVAATKWNAAWAVGSGGTVLHYWRPPDPAAREAWLAQQEQQQQSQEQTGTSTTGGTQEQTGQQQTSIVTLGEWQPSGSSTGDAGADRLVTNGVVVEDGDDTPTPTRKRLVKNVRAIFTRTRSGGRKLIVRFRLTRRAEVSVAAKRGRTLIGRTRPQTLRRGLRQLVLPVRGKQPPTSLKLIARPARRAT
jgi:hypothetical protein